MSLTEVVDTQSTVISMQAKVINDLFQVLGQYMAAEELDALPAVRTVNDIAVEMGGI